MIEELYERFNSLMNEFIEALVSLVDPMSSAPTSTPPSASSLTSKSIFRSLAINDTEPNYDVDNPCGLGIRKEMNVTRYECLGNKSFSSREYFDSGRSLCSQCSSSADKNCPENCCTLRSNVLGYECQCPIDRYSGRQNCNDFIPFRCEVNLLKPSIPCSRPKDLLAYNKDSSGCYLHTLNEQINMSFALNCFVIGSYNLSNDDGQFNYFVRSGNRFALSVDPEKSFSARIFDLNDIDNFFEFGNLPLSSQSYIGATTLDFPLNLSLVTAHDDMINRYIHGGRIYFESGN